MSIRVEVSLDKAKGLSHIASNRVVVLAEVANNTLVVNDEASSKCDMRKTAQRDMHNNVHKRRGKDEGIRRVRKTNLIV